MKVDSTAPKHRKPLKVIARFIAKTLLGGITLLVLLIGIMCLDHYRETILPVPTGTFAVGRTSFIWRDTVEVDTMAPEPGTKKSLITWIWYPAASRQPAQTFEGYLPASWLKAIEKQRGLLMGHILTRDLWRVRTHSLVDAELSSQQKEYPIVLLRAGLAALVTAYSSLAEDLASHGYIVVGVDAPYRSSLVVFPDGRVIARTAQNNADQYSGAKKEEIAQKLLHAWSADMSYTLDRLAQLNTSNPSGKFYGRLDLDRVGMAGHSLGGATALQFCHDDARCKAGIDIDGAPLGDIINDSISQPFMFLLGDHNMEPDAETHKVLSDIRSVYNKLHADQRLWLAIHGANHFGFSDDGALLKSPVIMSILRTFGIVHMHGRRQLEITSAYICNFFDIYLKGAPTSVLNTELKYPEVSNILAVNRQ